MVRNSRKLVTLIAVTAAVALTAAGCSGGSDAAPTAAPTSSATSAPSATGVPASLVGMHVEGAEAEAACKKLFGFSTLWLFVVFALILIERALGMPLFAPVLG